MEKENKRNYWKAEEENLLKQWADKAQCYQWMHSRSNNIYSIKNALFTIPVIIISTITGTANFAQDRFNEEIKNYVVIGIGTLSIIAGIITTVSQFLKIAELNEGHRVASLSWGKFYRNIKTELTRHPLDRMSPLDLIKISRDEYDRLVELAPFIPIKVIKEFNCKFKKNVDLTKPEICDELLSTNVFELKESERKEISNMFSNNKTKEDPKTLRQRKIKKANLDDKTNKFKQTFLSLNGRYPTQQEITKHMSKFVDDTNIIPVTETDIEMDNLNNSNDHINIGHAIEESTTDGVIININQQILEEFDNENGDNENDDNENGDNENDGDNGSDNDGSVPRIV